MERFDEKSIDWENPTHRIFAVFLDRHGARYSAHSPGAGFQVRNVSDSRVQTTSVGVREEKIGRQEPGKDVILPKRQWKPIVSR